MNRLREKPRLAATMLGMVPYESVEKTASFYYDMLERNGNPASRSVCAVKSMFIV